MPITPVSVRTGTYRGYEGIPIPSENAELTHVDKGSPAGEYLRRFWHPVCYLDELGDVPVKVRLLGEDLLVVPIDNTNTLLLEFRHIPDDLEGVPEWWTDRGRMLPAQLPMSDDEVENQLHPGDYEAQVGQRPISIHDLEHLGTTDRGVMMFRRQLTRGIQDVRSGEDPPGLVRDEGRVVTTYTNDAVFRVPPPDAPDDDRALLRRVADDHAGRHLAR